MGEEALSIGANTFQFFIRNPRGGKAKIIDERDVSGLRDLAITKIINHPKLRNLPFFLETPNDLSGYAKEISLLKGLYRE